MRYFIIFVFFIMFCSCTDQMDGRKAAEQYCDCMKKNNSEKQYVYAYTICNAELAKKYRFYRIFFVDTKDKEFNRALPEASRDSTKKFIDAFLGRCNELDCY